MNKEFNKNIKLLYVEDDDIARENGLEYLENYFEHITEASNAIDALKLYSEHSFDIIITDIQMPKLNGLEFIQSVRQKDEQTHVIVISAFSSKEYLLKAIELKLVKYLIKPIKEDELYKALKQCVNVIENRSSNIFKINETCCFDTYNQTLFMEEQLVKLRAKELLLLSLLIKNKNRYVSYEEIENVVWQEDAMSKDALKTLVKNLKSKLPDHCILNLSGMGYKINV